MGKQPGEPAVETPQAVLPLDADDAHAFFVHPVGEVADRPVPEMFLHVHVADRQREFAEHRQADPAPQAPDCERRLENGMKPPV